MVNAIRVLIIEDEELVADYLKEALTRTGQPAFSCAVATNLSAGIGMLRGRLFDIILLDLGLPDSQGIGTAATLRTLFPEIPIVVLTGLADEEVAVKAMRMDIQDYLIKGEINGPLLARSIRYAIERKRSLEALRESEERFRAFFESAGAGTAQLDLRKGRFLQINDRLSQITGYSRDELLSKTFLEIIHPEERGRAWDLFTRIAAGELFEYDREKRYIRKDGQTAWVHVSATLIRNARGDPDRVAGVIQDITASKRAEQELKAGAERMQLAAQVANFGTYDINIATGEVFWSPEIRALFGLPAESPVTMSLEEGLLFVHPDDRDRIRRVLEASMDPHGGGKFRDEHRIVRSDGTVLWVNMRGETFFVGGGERRRPARTTGVLLDITERKRAEEALRVSEERYRALVHTTSSAVWRASADGRSLLELTGAVAEEYTQQEKEREWIDFIHPDDRQRTLETWTRAVETKTPYEAEHRSVHHDGTYHYYLSRGVPVSGPEGEVREWIGSSIDITERKKAELVLKESEERFREVFTHAPIGLVVMDLRGRYQHVNESFCRITGYTEQELMELDLRRLAHPEDWEHTDGEMKRLLQGEIPVFFQQKRYVRRDGSIVWVRVSAVVRRDASREPVQVIGLVEDVHERKLAEEALRESEERFRTLADNIAQLAWMASESGWIFWYNKRWLDYSGTSLDEMQGEGWRKMHHPDHVRRVVQGMDRSFRTGEPWEDTFPLRGSDGSYRWFLSRAIPIRNAQGRVVRWFGTNTDITERMEMEESIKHMAQHDTLTGLPNRRFFQEIASHEMAQARRHGRKMAIFFLDLDRFKEINDTLGHEAGDELLKQTASRLKAVIRTSDTVARIGGDEFNLIISDVYYSEYAAEVARKILDEIRRPFRIKSHELHVSTSIGISVFPDDSRDIDTLLRYADIAMYYAKEHGRNRLTFYNPVINTRSLERVKFENSLRRAIETGEFRLYLQPVVAVETRRVVSAEALLRWQHPERGLLEPRQFFDAAENIGYMREIDEWVLRTATCQIRAWMDQGITQCITVNVSSRQFESPDLVSRISGVLQETGMAPECLNIEITETTAMADIENTITRMKALSGIGVRVSIDNFGTGFSSLHHLKRMPISRLKIDRSFVQDIAVDSNDRAIVNAVLLLAHSLKLKVVAEGVEGDSQLSLLRELHCDEAQGYLFGRPLPMEQFRELISPR